MFKFRLQPVLDTRKAFEDKILREFSNVKKELARENLVLEQLEEEKLQGIARLRDMKDHVVAVSDIVMYASYMKYIQGRVEYQQMVVARISEELEAKRQELLEAVKKRKTMDNLKERQRQEYQMNLEMLEAKALDEMSIQAYSRREI